MVVACKIGDIVARRRQPSVQGAAMALELHQFAVDDAAVGFAMGVDGRMAATTGALVIVVVCWQWWRRALAFMAWIAKPICFCGLLCLQISFSGECALKFEISFCPRRSSGPPGEVAAPVTGSPGLTAVPPPMPPPQWDRPEDVLEPPVWPPRAKAPPGAPVKVPPPPPPLCGLCGLRWTSGIRCALCCKVVCQRPTCVVIRCESCYDDRVMYDVNTEVEEQVLHRMALARMAAVTEKQTQTCTTYTSLRRAAQPRFQVLPGSSEGVWDADGNLHVTLAGVNVRL